MFIYNVNINEEKIEHEKINNIKISEINFDNLSKIKIIIEKFIVCHLENIIKIKKFNENRSKYRPKIRQLVRKIL